MSTVPEVFVRWEGFVRWLLPRTMRFPSSLRHSLTSRIENHALSVFEALVDARYGRDRRRALAEAGSGVEKLRLLLRLAHDLRALDDRAFAHACSELDEAGRSIGGWARHAAEARP